MSVGEIVNAVEEHGFNVTFSGGDPIYQAAPLRILAEELKRRGYTIWCYTGFLFEELLADPAVSPILPLLDVVVDGAFVKEKRDLSLRFRGSSNQRLVNVAETLRRGAVSLWNDPF